MTMSIYGMPVYVNDMLGWQSEVKQTRFPRSKKRRIRNKWAKNRRNWTARKWQVAEAYQIGGKLIMNSVALNAVKKEVEEAYK
jgi:hypothetical protein